MTFANRLKRRRLSNFDNDLPTLLIALHKYWCKTCQHVEPPLLPLLFTHSAVHWYAAVREQSVCPYSGNDMPPAKVFHQKPGWLKAEGKQIFRLSECLRHNFSGALLRHTFMWKITVIAYIFPCQSHLYPPPLPKNTIFLEMELLYFTSLQIHP